VIVVLIGSVSFSFLSSVAGSSHQISLFSSDYRCRSDQISCECLTLFYAVDRFMPILFSWT